MLSFFKEFPILNLLSYLGAFLLVWYVLAVVFTNYFNRRVFPSFLSGAFVSQVLILNVIFIYAIAQFTFNFTAYYVNNSVYLILWLIFILGLILAIFTYFRLGQEIMDLVPTSRNLAVKTTPREFDHERDQLSSFYKNLRGWVLWFLLGGIGLIGAYQYQPQVLVSILMDNSSSMDERMEDQMSALRELSNSFPENTKFLLATIKGEKAIQQKDPKQNPDKIFGSERASDISAAKIRTFNNPQNLKVFLSRDVPTYDHTPLTKAIWQLFLYSEKKDFAGLRKYLFVTTDGAGKLITKLEKEGRMYSLTTTFSENSGQSIYQFFEKVKIIRVGNRVQEAFFRDVPESSLLSMKNFTGFKSAFKKGMQDIFKRDWLYMWYFIIPVGIFILAVLLMPAILRGLKN